MFYCLCFVKFVTDSLTICEPYCIGITWGGSKRRVYNEEAISYGSVLSLYD